MNRRDWLKAAGATGIAAGMPDDRTDAAQKAGFSGQASVTAAAHLSPLVDYADLDGNLLISNDSSSGVLVKNGKLILPDRPGLGLTKGEPR